MEHTSEILRAYSEHRWRIHGGYMKVLSRFGHCCEPEKETEANRTFTPVGFDEFQELETEKKTDILVDHGRILMTSPNSVLYALYDFMVEVVIEKGEGIKEVVAFKRGSRLDKYLDRIKLPL